LLYSHKCNDMKFTFTAHINVPPQKAFALFINKNNLKEWQQELTSYETLSGQAGEVGAVTQLNYKTVTIIETILAINAPYEMKGRYEHKAGKKTVMVHNTSHRFRPVGENETVFELEMQEVQFIGWLPKLMSKLMGSMFEKYHQKEVDHFKAFAEK